MATYQTYVGGNVVANGSGGNYAGAPMVTVLEAVFDASRRNLAALDVVEALNVPAGTFVKNVFVEVIAGDAGQQVNVGDGADPNGYVAAQTVATAGTVAKGAGALAVGKLYTADDTIDIEVPATFALDTLKLRIVAEVVLLG